MPETATLHFDLSHLSPDQAFTLHVGASQHDLAPHTPDTLARARRSNSALTAIPGSKVTHFAGAVPVPADAPVMLRVTAPRRNPADPLDRLVMVAVRLPRTHRAAALAQRRRGRGAPLRAAPKLVSYGLADADQRITPDLLPDETLLDLGDLVTADDVAYALVFHHPELMTTDSAQAAKIMAYIETARGIDALANVIKEQGGSHDSDASQPGWVISKPGLDYQTSGPSAPIYAWSDETKSYARPPLWDTLQATKDDTDLQGQCWSVLVGTTQVPMTVAPPTKAAVGDPVITYTVKELTPQSGVEHKFSYDPGSRTATVSLKNYYLRWLKISVDQYTAGDPGKPVGSTAVLGDLSPVSTIMGVPLAPDWNDFSFTFDDEASRAVVSLGGLGQAPISPLYDNDGYNLTALFQYAVPAFFIVAGKIVDESAVWDETQKSVASKVLTIMEAATGGPIATVAGGSDPQLSDFLNVLENAAPSLALGVITGQGCEALQEFIAEEIGEAVAEKAAPFIGWISTAIGAAADVASMIQTTVEVARSPATMSLDIERLMDVTITVTGDPRHGNQLPATATSYLVSVVYDSGPVYAYADVLPATTQTQVTHTFDGLPAGRHVTVLASFFSSTGWLAGHGLSPSTLAVPDADGTLAVPSFAATENKVPLTATTTYSMKEKLGFQGGSRVWLPSPPATAPVATYSDHDGSNVGQHIGNIGQLTLNEAKSALGYSWQASGQNVPLGPPGPDNPPVQTQLWSYQAISDAVVPESGLKFPGYGAPAPSCLAFPPPVMANPVADGFLLEPSLDGNSMLLRALSLEPGQPLIGAPGQAFGRFTSPQDDLAIHPSGYAVALDSTTSKLQVVRLTAAVADASAPAAAILAGQGNRAGLLNNPVAVSCSTDRIVVLQASDADNYPQGCLCAFDVRGNPVNCFGSGTKSPVAALRPEGTAAVQLVDLSVEPTGYVYVLKYLVNPSSGRVQASDYRLDIYNQDGSFLVQVPGIAAARLHVDLWRNVFTLNWEIIPGSGRTEPSVSQWIPSTPGA